MFPTLGGGERVSPQPETIQPAVGRGTRSCERATRGWGCVNPDMFSSIFKENYMIFYGEYEMFIMYKFCILWQDTQQTSTISTPLRHGFFLSIMPPRGWHLAQLRVDPPFPRQDPLRPKSDPSPGLDLTWEGGWPSSSGRMGEIGLQQNMMDTHCRWCCLGSTYLAYVYSWWLNEDVKSS